jgi:hypothetical protein
LPFFAALMRCPVVFLAIFSSRMTRQSGLRFADKIMRKIYKLARDLTQNRYPLLLIALY